MNCSNYKPNAVILWVKRTGTLWYKINNESVQKMNDMTLLNGIPHTFWEIFTTITREYYIELYELCTN